MGHRQKKPFQTHNRSTSGDQHPAADATANRNNLQQQQQSRPRPASRGGRTPREEDTRQQASAAASSCGTYKAPGGNNRPTMANDGQPPNRSPPSGHYQTTPTPPRMRQNDPYQKSPQQPPNSFCAEEADDLGTLALPPSAAAAAANGGRNPPPPAPSSGNRSPQSQPLSANCSMHLYQTSSSSILLGSGGGGGGGGGGSGSFAMAQQSNTSIGGGGGNYHAYTSASPPSGANPTNRVSPPMQAKRSPLLEAFGKPATPQQQPLSATPNHFNGSMVEAAHNGASGHTSAHALTPALQGQTPPHHRSYAVSPQLPAPRSGSDANAATFYDPEGWFTGAAATQPMLLPQNSYEAWASQQTQEQQNAQHPRSHDPPRPKSAASSSWGTKANQRRQSQDQLGQKQQPQESAAAATMFPPQGHPTSAAPPKSIFAPAFVPSPSADAMRTIVHKALAGKVMFIPVPSMHTGQRPAHSGAVEMYTDPELLRQHYEKIQQQQQQQQQGEEGSELAAPAHQQQPQQRGASKRSGQHHVSIPANIGRDIFVAQLPFDMPLATMNTICTSICGDTVRLLHAAPHMKRGKSYDGCAFMKVTAATADHFIACFHKSVLFDYDGVWFAADQGQRRALMEYCDWMQRKSPDERRQILGRPIPFSTMTAEFAKRSYVF